MNDKEKYVLNNYEITKEGEIYSSLNSNNGFKRKKLLLREEKDGYYDVSLVYNDEGGRQPFRVHRLVLLKFKKRPKGHDIVNHKDLNKKNNHMDNLEWSTVQLNTQHGYDNGAYKSIKRVKTEFKGEAIVFPSISHASRYHEYSNPSTLQQMLSGLKLNPVERGKRKGLKIEFTEDEVTQIRMKYE